jgi:hypothetical protein
METPCIVQINSETFGVMDAANAPNVGAFKAQPREAIIFHPDRVTLAQLLLGQ